MKKALQRVKRDRTILQTLKIRKANWIGHTLCRNCLLKYIIEGEIKGWTEVTGRGGRRCQQLRYGRRIREGNGNRNRKKQITF